ncbi:MAG: hypothetical protein JSW00_16740 [Thermoplasmata archaeon]|nr:MAG: hypothetical protein JSW00_16740 [Thermoplasmata archaeon]
MDQGPLTKYVRFHIILDNILLLIIIPFIFFAIVGILTREIVLAFSTLIVSVFIILILLLFYPPLKNLVVKGNRIQRWHLAKIEELEKARKKVK